MLGKAREIADSIGDRVLALVAADSLDPQQLIYLGADEVAKAPVNELGDWIEIVSDLLAGENKPKLVLFPSNIISNVVMGAVYSKSRSKIGCYFDEADNVEGTIATKSFDSSRFALQKTSGESKTSLVALRIASVSPPFEDTSRYGKTTELQLKKATDVFPILVDAPETPMNSSCELTVLIGATCDDRVNEQAQQLAKKYHSRVVKYSGAVEVVYGPCLAIDLNEKLRDLPEFEGDLISINASKSPINSISDLAVVSLDIPKILERMLA